MGLFGSDSGIDFEKIPSTPEQNDARGFLIDQYQSDFNYPQQQFAGLSTSEQGVQDQLKDFLAGSDGGYGLTQDFYRNILNEDYKPQESELFQGVSSHLEKNKDKDQARVRRAAQKSGAARGTSYLKKESRAGQVYDTARNDFLTTMLNQRRELQKDSATGLVDSRGQEIGQLAEADQTAQKERELEQQNLNAAYTKQIQDLLADFQYNSPIAQDILNEQRYSGYAGGGGLKTGTEIGLVVGAAVAAYFGQYGVAGSLMTTATSDNGLYDNNPDKSNDGIY